MRNLILWIAVALLGTACNTDKNTFIIDGELDGLGDATIYFVHPQESGNQIDSIQVTDGKFKIKGQVEHPNIYSLVFGQEYFPLEFILEPGIFKVSGHVEDIYSLQVEGGELQADFNDFQLLMKAISSEFSEVSNRLEIASINDDQEDMQAISEEIDDIKSKYYSTAYDFVEQRPVDILSAMLISDILITKPDVARLQLIVDQFDDYVKKTSYGQKVINTLSTVAKTATGVEAPLFTMNDDQDEPFSLESYRGKYVLIDFWAAWCGPCRKENPRLVQVYDEFKSPDFEILGVSIDHNKQDWLKAIVDDNLSWKQVRDEGDVSGNDYGVVAIPTNILIDPEGIIIGRNLFGKELTDKLKELL